MRKFIARLASLFNMRAVDRESSRENWTSTDWARVRGPERHRDRMLSERAQRWVDSLPVQARPIELTRQFPRVVNRLASLWHDEGLAELKLFELLVDTRGGRKGFPLTVTAELDVLYELHCARVENDNDEDDESLPH